MVFWKWRRAAWQQPAVQIGITLSIIMSMVLGVSASARAIYSLPMVVTLAVVGAGAAHDIPHWIERTFAFLGITIGSVAIVFFWLVWAFLIASGQAPHWPWLGRWLPMDFVLTVSATTVTAAMVLTIGAVVLIAMTGKSKARGLVIWCVSLTVTWGLAATLWLPWIDAAKSYRAMYQTMKLALPSKMACMASRGLDESERAMLDYVLDIKTYRDEVGLDSPCEILLVESVLPNLAPVGDNMKLVWSGSRPGDTRERFDLYILNPSDRILALR